MKATISMLIHAALVYVIWRVAGRVWNSWALGLAAWTIANGAASVTMHIVNLCPICRKPLNPTKEVE